MHQQHVARRQISEQILPPPSETLNRLTPEPLLEILGDRPAQTAVAHLHLDYARALHGGRQTTAHAFDFGKLGHWLIGSSLIGSSLTHSAPKVPALWSCPQRTIGHGQDRKKDHQDDSFRRADRVARRETGTGE